MALAHSVLLAAAGGRAGPFLGCQIRFLSSILDCGADTPLPPPALWPCAAPAVLPVNYTGGYYEVGYANNYTDTGTTLAKTIARWVGTSWGAGALHGAAAGSGR